MNRNQPPKWIIRFFNWYCREDLSDAILGDLLELYERRFDEIGRTKANLLFILNTIQFFQPFALKKLGGTSRLNQYDMFKNNLKISFRILKKDKVFSFINVLGLATGLAISLLIGLYVKFEVSYESYNPNADRMVRLTTDYMNGETVADQDCETYPPTGKRITSEFSEVSDFTRAYHIDGITVEIDKQFFNEPKTYGVDPSFFRLFNYPLLQGNQEAIFQKPYELVLTESTAIKYFDDVNVVGKMISLADVKQPFRIAGIVRDCPENTHLKFSMLVSYPTMIAAFGEKENNWNGNNTYTYLELIHADKFAAFSENLQMFNDQLHTEKLMVNDQLVAQPIGDIHLYSRKSFEPEVNGDAKSVFFLLWIAVLVILIAIVNYINLSTSKSLDRAKEVGIRKVIGSSLSQLRSQFFTESLLINLLAGMFAVGFMLLFLEPFRNMANLPEAFNFMNDGVFWIVFLGVLVVSTVLSGVFSAFVLSSFRPVSILNGNFSQTGSGAFLRKSLVVLQFSITIFLLVQTLAANTQIRFLKTVDLGVNADQTITISRPVEAEMKSGLDPFRESIASYPQFASMTLSESVPGLETSHFSTSTGIRLKGGEKNGYNFYINRIDAHFFETMKINMLSGETFQKGKKNKMKLIVNQQTLKLWGLNSASEALGSKVDMWGIKEPFEIAGVVEDFYQTGPKDGHIAMIFMYKHKMNSFLSIRLQSQDIRKDIATIKKVYSEHFPQSPFEYFFIDEKYDQLYKSDEQFQNVLATLASFAVLIACMGLFGLASFMVTKRTKEIGIRKTLGADVSQLVVLLSKDFLKLVFISVILAIPVAYYVVDGWLGNYAERIELNVWIFVLPALLVVVLAALIVGSKTLKISSINPAFSLKDE